MLRGVSECTSKIQNGVMDIIQIQVNRKKKSAIRSGFQAASSLGATLASHSLDVTHKLARLTAQVYEF